MTTRYFKEIGRNPNVDWMTMVVVTIFVIVSLCYLDFTLYNAVTNGSIQGNGGQTSSSFTKINEKAISSVIDTLKKKEDVSDKARAGYSGYSNPAVPQK